MEEALEKSSQSFQNGDSSIPIQEYCLLLETLAHESKLGGAPQRAETWMKQLLRLVSDRKDVDLDLLLQCFNAVIWAWANNTRESPSLCVVRAELWLEQISKFPQIQPNTHSFHGLLHACSKGRLKNRKQLESHATKAQDILRHMQQVMRQNNNNAVWVNKETYNYVIRAWTRCKPSPETTNHVMDLLREMEQASRNDIFDNTNNVHPNIVSYAMAMDSWSNLAGRQARRHQQDSKQNVHNDHKNGMYQVQQVQALLNYIHKLHDAHVPNVQPNTVVYNILISAWTRISGPQFSHVLPHLQAERILRRMQTELKDLAPPDSLSYTKVILAWSKSKKPNSGIRSNFWLQQLWQAHYEEQIIATRHDRHDQNSKFHGLLPQVGTYNAVIQAWANVGNAQEAESILKDMLLQRPVTTLSNHHQDKIFVPPLPNTESFSHVIFAWLRLEKETCSGEGCQRAAEWLHHLIDTEEGQLQHDTVLVTSTPEMFHGILKAAAHSQRHGLNSRDSQRDGGRLLDLAIDVFDKYRASRHFVNYNAYVWLLQLGIETLAASHYTSQERNTFIHQLVQDCCKDGLVTNAFVRTLANGTVYYKGWTVEESLKTTQQVFPKWPLPGLWSRNVTQKFHLPTFEDSQRVNFNIQIQ